MPYRQDDDARNRLARRLSELRLAQARDEPVAKDEVDQLVRGLKEAEPATTSQGPPRSMWPRVSIASPCSEEWATMVGDDRARRCARCDRDVYDLSKLTRLEIEAFLEERGEPRCVRLYRRADGRILTADCERGQKRQIALRVLSASAAAVAIAVGASAVYPQSSPAPTRTLAVYYAREPLAVQGELVPRAAPAARVPDDPWADELEVYDDYAARAQTRARVRRPSGGLVGPPSSLETDADGRVLTVESPLDR